ncbi:type II secretion system protein [Candidatus Uabimicrobium sp. HlEnr_7]|uniref:type II secretion system protein n=1 Tax=Candidatus Uabimicrobium helgolandensis TaxID=3095367 RepID=UPI003557B01C
MKKNSGFTLIELLVVVAIIGVLASILIPAIQKAVLSAHRAEIKALLSTVDQSLAMYNSDLGAFPPDGNTSGGGVNDCTPTNRAAERGEFNEEVSDYADNNLVRHLDGDTSNDGDVDGLGQVSARPLDNYLDVNEESLTNAAGDPVGDGDAPILTTRFGTTVKYNEMDSERRTQKFQRDQVNEDPREAVIRFDTYQMFCEAEDIEIVDPSRIITNFTE